MMRTPKHLDKYAPELTEIWKAGWGIRHYRIAGGLGGVAIRLEKNLLLRGAPWLRWWWRPTLGQAVRKAAREAAENPITQRPEGGAR